MANATQSVIGALNKAVSNTAGSQAYDTKYKHLNTALLASLDKEPFVVKSVGVNRLSSIHGVCSMDYSICSRQHDSCNRAPVHSTQSVAPT